jgi:hypothetical protein
MIEPTAQFQRNPISYQPIMPPVWVALPSDEILYKRPDSIKVNSETLLSLDERASCPCGPGACQWSFYTPDNDIEQKDCVVYGLDEGIRCRIELQRCPNPSCRSIKGRKPRYIGPETRDLGIFNFDNNILFTHELLDDYTNQYSASETPFNAWITVINRRYMAHPSKERFVIESTFRSVWFAYVNIQRFENDMRCPQCGPTPKDTIWDGVTLAFHEKHRLPTLRPPTMTHDSSVSRGSRAVKCQQPLKDKSLRKLVRKIIDLKRPMPTSEKNAVAKDSAGGAEGTDEGESVESGGEDEDAELIEDTSEADSGDEGEDKVVGKESEWMKTYRQIPTAVQGLTEINDGLGTIFDIFFGEGSVLPGVNLGVRYKAVKGFFAQVRWSDLTSTFILMKSR